MRMLRVESQLSCFLAAAVICLAGVFSARATEVQVPVPRITIYPGQVIEEQMLVGRVFRSSTALRASTVSSSAVLVGKVARQTLLPGHPIDMDAVRDPYVVTQGQAALIMFQSGALTITSIGLALQSGGSGDEVSVRNTDSGRIIKGTIGPDGAVHVGDP
jgi:flagella basal body P-ring formation protein FlgA